MRPIQIRKWEDTVKTGLNNSALRRQHMIDLAELFEKRVSIGWMPFLLTFQFPSLSGSKESILRQMGKRIGVFYRQFGSRVQRYPTTEMGSRNMPVILCCADLPVPKRVKKTTSVDLNINDGLHVHGICVLPPFSRVADLQAHLMDHHYRYCGCDKLVSIHAEPIQDNIRRTTDYAFKTVTKGRLAVC